MIKVYSLEEAMNWFLNNSSGNITCVRKDGESQECSSYPEAKKFYSQNKKK